MNARVCLSSFWFALATVASFAPVLVPGLSTLRQRPQTVPQESGS